MAEWYVYAGGAAIAGVIGYQVWKRYAGGVGGRPLVTGNLTRQDIAAELGNVGGKQVEIAPGSTLDGKVLEFGGVAVNPNTNPVSVMETIAQVVATASSNGPPPPLTPQGATGNWSYSKNGEVSAGVPYQERWDWSSGHYTVKQNWYKPARTSTYSPDGKVLMTIYDQSSNTGILSPPAESPESVQSIITSNNVASSYVPPAPSDQYGSINYTGDVDVIPTATGGTITQGYTRKSLSRSYGGEY